MLLLGEIEELILYYLLKKTQTMIIKVMNQVGRVCITGCLSSALNFVHRIHSWTRPVIAYQRIT